MATKGQRELAPLLYYTLQEKTGIEVAPKNAPMLQIGLRFAQPAVQTTTRYRWDMPEKGQTLSLPAHFIGIPIYNSTGNARTKLDTACLVIPPVLQSGGEFLLLYTTLLSHLRHGIFSTLCCQPPFSVVYFFFCSVLP